MQKFEKTHGLNSWISYLSGALSNWCSRLRNRPLCEFIHSHFKAVIKIIILIKRIHRNICYIERSSFTSKQSWKMQMRKSRDFDWLDPPDDTHAPKNEKKSKKCIFNLYLKILTICLATDVLQNWCIVCIRNIGKIILEIGLLTRWKKKFNNYNLYHWFYHIM